MPTGAENAATHGVAFTVLSTTGVPTPTPMLIVIWWSLPTSLMRPMAVVVIDIFAQGRAPVTFAAHQYASVHSARTVRTQRSA
ncbi:hypothetical protein GCM10010412_092500 [Nonomuraea recticatena]|uniref:Uncharacterized protein n=2 Tax=Nonomuraea recticatena TaxID=46178 RepID=A0ABN3TD26_9ACTN